MLHNPMYLFPEFFSTGLVILFLSKEELFLRNYSGRSEW